MKRLENKGLGILVLVLVTVLSGCSSLPTGGAVGTSMALGTPKRVHPMAGIDPPEPQENANPTDIIAGFVKAASGVENSFQVARKYLASDIANSWNGSESTTVYSGEPQIIPDTTEGAGTNAYRVSVRIVAKVDADGVLNQAAPDTVESFPFVLRNIAGQWRIGSLSQGILLAKGSFDALFRARNLYFYDPTFHYLVPDARWFPGQGFASQGTSMATLMVKSLLKGPAPYLTGAVESSFPSTVKLLRDSVPIVNTQAVVDLSAQPFLDAGPEAQRQMHLQLLTSLKEGMNVTSVQMRAGQAAVAIDEGNPDGVSPHVPQIPERQVGVASGRLVWVEKGTVTPVDGMPIFSAPPKYPAQSYTREGAVAFLGIEGRSLYTVMPDAPVLQRVVDIPLTAPSFSASGWVFSAATDGSGRVFVVRSNRSEPPIVLTLAWLKGKRVTAFRLSRDGTRALIVSVNPDGLGTTVEISGVLKRGNAPDSAPRYLTKPQRIFPEAFMTQAYWSGENTFILAQEGLGPSQPIEYSLDALAPVHPGPVKDLLRLSVGESSSTMYAQTSSGAILVRSGNGWAPAPFGGVADLAFTG